MSAPGRSPGRRPPPSEARLPLTGASSTASWHPAPVLQATPVQSQHRPPHEHPSPERSLPPSVPRTTYTCTHAHTCTRMHNTHMLTHAHKTPMHAHTCTSAHTYSHACVHTHRHTHMQTHTCTRMDMHTHMHAHRDVHTHTALPSFQADGGESPP